MPITCWAGWTRRRDGSATRWPSSIRPSRLHPTRSSPSTMQRARGQHREARRLLRRFLRAYPSYFPAAVVLAATETDLGHPQRALSVTQHALRYGPNSPELHVERAIALEAVGRRDEARLAF